MEDFGYFIVFILGAALVYAACVYVIFPVASVLTVLILIASVVYALIVSLHGFITAVKDCSDPYATYTDKHSDVPAGVKRNYFFGPGYHQISEIIKEAYTNLRLHWKNQTDLKDRALRHRWYIDMWIYFGYGLAVFCTLGFGTVWVTAFSVILAAIIIIGMIGFFAFFSVLWLTDRAVLLLKSIHNRCPVCKRKSIIPVFVCPTCGLEHKKLVPGPYGVIKRTCACGATLATTFLGRRSEYEAHCPFCDAELYSSSSQQYGIQLVGGVGTGKTTFLAAFWNEYKEWLKKHHTISYVATPEDAFADLEAWFNTGNAEATNETNANMYSIIHTGEQDTSVQMTIYDIAGEAFDFARSEVQQQQFRYCEGFLIVIDPTADPDYVSETITNFIHSFDEIIGKQAAKSASMPVAVMITKSDLHKRTLGYPHIRATYKASAMSFPEHQDHICRSFLFEHGYENAVNLIEAKFSNIRFFPVSAMGHKKEDGEYEPWGVLEPVFWLMDHDNCPLRAIIH